ncbi:hypothetical protein [Psychrobacter urativorans]|uniref:hypothetical protein n=1 Tax=Psychrobacter urativorans TaxID=45610 RepID=UPI00191AEB3A|nr:hypothetical protein [Psychrobacter urativorans]
MSETVLSETVASGAVVADGLSIVEAAADMAESSAAEEGRALEFGLDFDADTNNSINDDQSGQ